MRWTWWLAVAVIALMSIVASAPARLVWGPLARTEPALHLSGFHGTLWRGSIEELRWRDLGPATLHWRVRYLPLAVGRLTVDGVLEAPWGEAGVFWQRRTGSDSSWQIDSLRVDLERVPWIGLGVPFRLKGHISTDREFFIAGDAAVPHDARGTMAWQGARVTAPLGVGLGDVTATPQESNSAGIRWRITNRGGDLGIAGLFSIAREGRYQFSATLTPRATGSEELRQMLDWMLAKNGDAGNVGEYRLEFAGRLGGAGSR